MLVLSVFGRGGALSKGPVQRRVSSMQVLAPCMQRQLLLLNLRTVPALPCLACIASHRIAEIALEAKPASCMCLPIWYECLAVLKGLNGYPYSLVLRYTSTYSVTALSQFGLVRAGTVVVANTQRGVESEVASAYATG